MKLIVGLGNPGEKYAANRHNVGFMAVDEMARGYSFGPWKKRFQGLAAEGQIGLKKCILLKPATYMNESGRAVGEAMRFYKLSLSDVIVIHDELDLKPGTIRVKTGGGNAGHNGLKSISAHAGNEYVRVRIGIGHPGDKALVADYVLHDFAKDDKAWLDPLLEGVARGVARLVEGSEAAFLSEAARGRGQPAPAAQAVSAPHVEGAPRTVNAPRKEEAVASNIDELQEVLAAASRPIQAMTFPSIPVAAREGGGGAVSAAVILPEPAKPAPIPVKEPEPRPAPAAPKPEPAPVTMAERPRAEANGAVIPPQPEIKVTPAQPAESKPDTGVVIAAAAQPEPAPAAEAAQSTPAKAEEAAVPAAAAAKDKKQSGIFGSWFRSRVRGAST
jgi:PTH1 family peptidyl-tRNA hydrolase